MSKENVKKFFAKVEQDENIRNNFLIAMEDVKPEIQNEAAEKIIKVAAAAGFNFNSKELFEARAELIDMVNSNPELSDKELGAVSGGITDSKFKAVTASVTTAGIACAVMSIIGEATVKQNSAGCAAWLTINKNVHYCNG
jgi:predicted ribosomally synthesized peptide with nif11-like leader